ncbi:MAG TPA: L-threonylcarbamoyladenylate synthase [Candidatus Peribacterales bacterium]|nr:L-threonylcarbamoyladenylate synthase [Candidatus Peribacterales bacterium]
MRILRVDQGLEEAIEVIRSGGVVAHATETCYGFACDLTKSEAVERLFLLKGRLAAQSVSALFPSIEEAKEWVEWNEKAEELARKYLPGPLTIVLTVKKGMRTKGKGIGETMGVRISSHPIAQKLAELTRIPLSTTSANLHGKPNTYSVKEIVDQFSGREVVPDLILDSGELPHAEPSTVIVIEQNKVKVVRRGSIDIG